MSTFIVNVRDIIISEWDNEQGQGAHVCNKGGFELAGCSTVMQALESIESFIGYKLDRDHLDGSGWFISASVIGNADGYACQNGKYIADYFFSITERKELNMDLRPYIN
jgi:hypothetical protein